VEGKGFREREEKAGQRPGRKGEGNLYFKSISRPYKKKQGWVYLRGGVRGGGNGGFEPKNRGEKKKTDCSIAPKRDALIPVDIGTLDPTREEI